MEYLMTYGWAILILAIVVGVLFALGLFNGSAATPNGCSPQPGFTCSNPVYTPNGITATISQDSGQNYYDAWVFVASEGENIGPGGLPVNFSESNTVNMTPIGTIPPSGTVTFNFNHTAAGGIPTANIPVGTEFTGYIWIAYCLSPVCSGPTNFAKVGSISAKETGVSTFTSGGPTTTSSSTTSSSTTSTSTTSIYYVVITLTPSSATSAPFQQNITISPSSYSGQCPALGSTCVSSDLGNIRFYSSMSGNVPSGPLDSWLEGCPETPCSPSSTQALFWVNLPSGESTPNTVIYMVFNSLGTEFDGSVAGEAPQLSPSYAQYDNGPTVFNLFYDNFAGHGLNQTKWYNDVSGGACGGSQGSGSNQWYVDNGLIGSPNGNWLCFYTKSTFPYPYITEEYIASQSNTYPAIYETTSGSHTGGCYGQYSSSYFGFIQTSSPYVQFIVDSPSGSCTTLSTSTSNPSFPDVVEVGWFATGNEYASESNLGTKLTSSDSTVPIANSYIGITFVNLNIGGSSAEINYVIGRSSPPAGQMPQTECGPSALSQSCAPVQ
jgi:hypothetical protein